MVEKLHYQWQPRLYVTANLEETRLPGVAPGALAPPPGWRDRLLGRSPYPAVFRRQPAAIITPRDFDLSPYFEIVKLGPIEIPTFDYRRIRWDEAESRAASRTRS